jgi:hypothetical protein
LKKGNEIHFTNYQIFGNNPIPKFLENQRLKKLNLSGISTIHYHISKIILKCSSLQHLNLTNCFDNHNYQEIQRSKNEIYEALNEVDNLNEIIFQDNKLGTEDFKSIIELLKRKMNLHQFDIRYCNLNFNSFLDKSDHYSYSYFQPVSIPWLAHRVLAESLRNKSMYEFSFMLVKLDGDLFFKFK